MLLTKYDGAKNAYRKLETKICHVIGRVERMKPDNEEDNKTRSELLSQALSLSSDLEEKTENFKKLRFENLPTDPVLLESLHMASASTPYSHGREIATGNATTAIDNSSVNKYVRDLGKINIKFSGDVSKLSVNAFLIQIEEFCALRNIPKDQLIHAASELFVCGFGNGVLVRYGNCARCKAW